jgi:hypothetical protein
VGEGSVDEGWKEKLGAAALAGTMALGANARVMPGDDANINRLTGKPIATQQTTNTSPEKASTGYSKEYLQKAADPKRIGRFMISVEKAQELLKNMQEGYTVTRGIDTERYQARDGLEGPFSAKNGKVVYYDKREGKYYDPDTDMYIEHDEWQAMNEAEYQGRKVPLGKPMQGDVAKSKVYVKNPQGNVVKVNFGDKNMRIKKSNPGRRKNFRARHNCDNPGPRHKARYWSCRAW